MNSSTTSDFDTSTYHYPGDVLDLLVETISRIRKAKDGVLDFFHEAGVRSPLAAKWRTALTQDRTKVYKKDIARDFLKELNERRGNEGLRLRREVVKRIVQFDDFTACWDNDRLEAEGLVARVRQLVQAKDTLTQINLERQRERSEHTRLHEQHVRSVREKKVERERIRKDLFALFAEPDHRKRGIALEGILNRLFASFQILVREAFRRRGDDGQGTIEQIDGVIELDGHLYLIEMKWHTEKLGPEPVGHHISLVFTRGDVRGLIISNSGYTPAAIAHVKEGLSHKVLVLAELSELVFLLENDHDLYELIRRKAHAAQLEKNPLFSVMF